MGKKERFFTWPVLSLVALSFFLGTSEFIVVGILPEIADGLQVPLTQAGSVVSLFAFVYALGTPFLAALAGKFRRRRVMVLGMGVFALSNLVCALSPGYGLFVFSRIITAVVSGTLISVAMTYAGDVASPQNMPKAVAWIFTGFSVASVFGVPIATSVCHALGWRAAFILIFAASGILLFVLWRVLPVADGRRSDSVMKQFLLFGNKKIVLGVVAVVLSAAAVYTVYTYLTPLLQTGLRIPDTFISMALLLYGAAALASNLLSGRLAAKSGIRKMPFIYLILTVCLAVLPLTCSHQAAGAVNLLGLGILMYLMNSPIQMFFLQTAAKENPSCVNLASSLNSVFFNLGIALGSFLGGVVVDTAGLPYVGLGGAVLAALAGGVCAALVAVSAKTPAAVDV